MGELETYPQFKSAIALAVHPIDLCMYGVGHVSGQLSFLLNRLLSILSFPSPQMAASISKISHLSTNCLPLGASLMPFNALGSVPGILKNLIPGFFAISNCLPPRCLSVPPRCLCTPSPMNRLETMGDRLIRPSNPLVRDLQCINTFKELSPVSQCTVYTFSALKCKHPRCCIP